jgi:hypothetical protein
VYAYAPNVWAWTDPLGLKAKNIRKVARDGKVNYKQMSNNDLIQEIVPVKRGTKGSTRLDVYDPATGTVWDYIFTINPGQGLKQKQINKILKEGPLNINHNRIFEVNP